MRWTLLGISLFCALVAGYLGTAGRSSFSSYSSEQLDLLQHELDGPRAHPTEQEAFAKTLLEAERRRRITFPSTLALAVLGALAAFVVPSARVGITSSSGTPDERRLRAAIGDPALALEGARHKAATLLGVNVSAPSSVIEAALEAQLKDRDMGRLQGLAPDLQKLALEQREALVKARDLLLKKQA
jgi:hypothetical protein